MSSNLPDLAPIESDTGARKPPVIHKVMKEFEHLAVKPAMCGFIIRPTNRVAMPQAIIERAKQCEECLTIMLEIDLAWS